MNNERIMGILTLLKNIDSAIRHDNIQLTSEQLESLMNLTENLNITAESKLDNQHQQNCPQGKDY